MSVTKITPYLFFDGNAAEALAHYERSLGATVEGLMHYGDMQRPCSEADQGRVMHALVHIGQATLMVSDSPASTPAHPRSRNSTVLEFEDVDDMTRRFSALASDGEVLHAIHDTFWGAKFGVLKDAYGQHWMFNCMTKPATDSADEPS